MRAPRSDPASYASLQDGLEWLQAALAAKVAERAKLSSAADAAVAHSSERDRVKAERRLLEQVASQQEALIKRQVRPSRAGRSHPAGRGSDAKQSKR